MTNPMACIALPSLDQVGLMSHSILCFLLTGTRLTLLREDKSNGMYRSCLPRLIGSNAPLRINQQAFRTRGGAQGKRTSEKEVGERRREEQEFTCQVISKEEGEHVQRTVEGS